MIPDNIPFTIYSSCIPVKGCLRSVICDLQRHKTYYIPNSLYDLIKKYKGQSIQFVKGCANLEDHKFIDEYFEFLVREDLIFFTETPNQFPDLGLIWKSPSHITNAIIDVSELSALPWQSILADLDNLGCKFLQIRFFSDESLSGIKNVLDIMEGKIIEGVDIFLRYDPQILPNEYIGFLNNNSRMSILYLFNHEINECFYTAPYNDGHIFYIKENISTSLHCGQIFPKDFSINIPTFTESHHHNSCLNRKIAIDVEGNIKNCPSMPNSFGNIRDITLLEALEHRDFKKYWNITKDHVEVCKDCEFRYICTDCRAYIENPDDVYSKPLKCGYNPYTCEWEDWSTNPLKQKAIDFYGMRDVLPEFKMKPDYAPAQSD